MKATTLMAVMVGVATMLGPVGAVANGDVLRDNFNDSQRSSIWKKEVDKIKIRERHGRLETRSKLSGGGHHESGYVANGWKFRYTNDFTIKLKYHLDLSSVQGRRDGGVGMRVIPGGVIDKVYVGIRETSDGLWLSYESWVNGELYKYKYVPISRHNGTLKIKYNATADRLDIYINRTRYMRFYNFLAGVNTGNGLAEVGIGASRNGFVPWGWRNAWIDDFKIRGQIIN